jgi:hypothetical protein
MKTAQIHKRLERLATKLSPGAIREFTLEELCRLYWRRDKRAFLRFGEREYSALHIFVSMFQREDEERALRAKPGARNSGIPARKEREVRLRRRANL